MGGNRRGRNNWVYKHPFEILSIAKSRNNSYADLTIDGLKGLYKEYISVSGKQGLGEISNRDDLALFWDNVLNGAGINSDSPGFLAIKKPGSEVVSKKLAADIIRLYGYPASESPPQTEGNSGSSFDFPVSSNCGKIVNNDPSIPKPPANETSKKENASKADIEMLVNQINGLAANIASVAKLADNLGEVKGRVDDVEKRLEQIEEADLVELEDLEEINSRISKIDTRVAGIEMQAILGVNNEAAFQEFLQSKAKFFDLADRSLRDGLLEVYIKNTGRYILVSDDNDITVNNHNLSQDLKANFVILNKIKNRNGSWKLKLKILETGGISVIPIMKHLLDSRTSFRGNLGLSLALPDQIECYRFTWFKWARDKIITCYDYSKNGSLILYVHHPDLGEIDFGPRPSIAQLKTVSKPIRVVAPDQLVMMAAPRREDLLKLGDNKFFVHRGQILERPETGDNTRGSPDLPDLPAINVANFTDVTVRNNSGL